MRVKRRCRFHLAEPHPGVQLPSIEGLLVSRRNDEYLVAVPELHVATGAHPVVLEDARFLAIPKSRVAFYEVIR